MDVTREKDRGGFFLPIYLSFLKQEVLLRTTSHKTNPVMGQKLGGSRTSHLQGGAPCQVTCWSDLLSVGSRKAGLGPATSPHTHQSPVLGHWLQL